MLSILLMIHQQIKLKRCRKFWLGITKKMEIAVDFCFLLPYYIVVLTKTLQIKMNAFFMLIIPLRRDIEVLKSLENTATT